MEKNRLVQKNIKKKMSIVFYLLVFFDIEIWIHRPNAEHILANLRMVLQGFAELLLYRGIASLQRR